MERGLECLHMDFPFLGLIRYVERINRSVNMAVSIPHVERIHSRRWTQSGLGRSDAVERINKSPGPGVHLRQGRPAWL